MRFFLLNLDYVVDLQGETKVRLFGKDEEGKLIEESLYFSPYFFVLPFVGKEKEVVKDIEELLTQKGKRVRKIEIARRKLAGEEKKFIKIVCFSPPDTQKIRDIVKKLEKKRGGSGSVVEEYQYSLGFTESFLLENKIYEPGWIEIKNGKINPVRVDEKPDLKVIAFDIEVTVDDGREKIIMISYFGKNLKKVTTYRKKGKYPPFVKIVKDEKELLEDFRETIKEEDPDIILTYNGDAFDFPMIRERAREYKVKIDVGRGGEEFKFVRRGRSSAAYIAGRAHIDLFLFINNILSPNLETEVLTLRR